MTDWAIRIPHRHRDESLIDVGSNCRHLPDDERDVVRSIVMDAAISGMKTAGQLLDHLEALEPTARRGLLDEARTAKDLPTTDVVDVRERMAALQRQRAHTDPIKSCAHEGCNAWPARPETGQLYDPGVKRWWCPVHEGEAEPGDMEPRGSGIKLSPGGVPIDDDPAADAAERQREATRAERLRVQAEIRAVEHAELVAEKAASDAALESTLPWNQARR